MFRHPPGAIDQLTQGFTRGIGIANVLQQMTERRRQQQFAEQLKPLQLQKLQADIAKQQQQAGMPFGGKRLQGAGGEIAALEAVKQQYGEDSDQYEMAKKYFETNLKYKSAAADNLLNPSRFAPPAVRAQSIAEHGAAGVIPQQGTLQHVQMIDKASTGLANTNLPAQGQVTSDAAGATLPQLSPYDDPNVRQAARDVATLGTTTSEQQKQVYAGTRFIPSTNNALTHMEQAKEYFGTAGQARLKRDMALALANPNAPRPPSLNSWYKLEQDIEDANLIAAKVNGVPAEKISRGDFKKVFNLHALVNDYASARALFQNAINLTKGADVVNRSHISDIMDSVHARKIEKRATEVTKGRQRSPLSDDQLIALARSRNIQQ